MKGCFTALLTPFNHGKIDFQSLEKLIQFQIDGGIDGVIPCGTTGESPTLSHDEHREVVRFTVDTVKKINQHQGTEVKVVAGSGSNSTKECLELSKDAEKFGVDGLLIVAPYYNKPSQEGLLTHFETIAQSVDIEIIVYNIPGRTGILINPETFIAMSERCRNINTIKEATGDIDYTGSVLSVSSQLDILSGNDNMNLPIYSLGGVGCISVLSNLLPDEVKKVLNFHLEGQVEEARKLHLSRWKLIETLFAEPNPAPLKSAAKILGLIRSDEVRLPLLNASSTIIKRLEQLVK